VAYRDKRAELIDQREENRDSGNRCLLTKTLTVEKCTVNPTCTCEDTRFFLDVGAETRGNGQDEELIPISKRLLTAREVTEAANPNKAMASDEASFDKASQWLRTQRILVIDGHGGPMLDMLSFLRLGLELPRCTFLSLLSLSLLSASSLY
jgi:hypothetical protein